MGSVPSNPERRHFILGLCQYSRKTIRYARRITQTMGGYSCLPWLALTLSTFPKKYFLCLTSPYCTFFLQLPETKRVLTMDPVSNFIQFHVFMEATRDYPFTQDFRSHLHADCHWPIHGLYVGVLMDLLWCNEGEMERRRLNLHCESLNNQQCCS